DPERVELQGFTGHHDSKIEHLLRDLLKEMQRPGHGDALRADTQAIALAERLIDYSGSVRAPEPSVATLSPVQLKNAIDFMEACLTRDFGIDEIAQFVGMPARLFAAAFEDATGETLTTFRTERRLDYVKEWVNGKSADAPASELARRAGFRSAEAMNAAFCAHIGITFENYRTGRLG
ncbi:MAG: AraC family transcriptional regulator, partial [Bacteroidota bacterium]